jgi:hypothetical protein
LVQSKLTKRAFITLKEGYSLNLAAQESMGAPAKEDKGE